MLTSIMFNCLFIIGIALMACGWLREYHARKDAEYWLMQCKKRMYK